MYQNNNRDRKQYNNQHSNYNNSSDIIVKSGFNENDEIVGENNLDYVQLAEKVIKVIDVNKLTTSKIRNILSMLSEIYKLVVVSDSKQLNANNISQIQYFKVRCLYESGRYVEVKDFINKSNLISLIDSIGDNKKRFENFYHYFEALVAYHRYLGGKD